MSGAYWKALLVIIVRWSLGFVLIFGVCLLIIAVADLVVASSKSVEKKHMERYVVSPLPPSMVHVKTLDLFRPIMGDGHCWVAYEMKPDDFDNILHKGKKPWHSGLIEMMDPEIFALLPKN